MEKIPPGPGSTPSGDSRAQACARIRRHLEQGAPWDACDVFREEAANFPRDPELLYLGALAHARAGASLRARALLDEAQANAGDARHLLADILSLRGRLSKDEFHRAPDAVGAMALAERARQEYLAAYALGRRPLSRHQRGHAVAAPRTTPLLRRPWPGKSSQSWASRQRRLAAGIMRRWARRTWCSEASNGRHKAMLPPTRRSPGMQAAWRRCDASCTCSRG